MKCENIYFKLQVVLFVNNNNFYIGETSAGGHFLVPNTYKK